MASFAQLQQLFIDNVAALLRQDNPFVPVDKTYLANVQAAAKAATTMKQLVGCQALLNINNFVGANLGYPPLKALLVPPLCFEYGSGTSGWYFVYGNMGNWGFVFCFFRLEVAPPVAVAAAKINPPDACLYTLFGGYGPVGGPWVVVPQNVCSLVPYVNSCVEPHTLSIAAKDDSIPLTFMLSAYPSGTFTLAVVLEGATISATLTPSAPPAWDSKDGCLCAGGIGTRYWSLPDCAVAQATLSTFPSGNANGTGWIDKQLSLGGNAYNNKLLQAVTNLKLPWTQNEPPRWFWVTVNMAGSSTLPLSGPPGNKQFMVVVPVTSYSPLAVGQTFQAALVNEYDGGTLTSSGMQKASLEVKALDPTNPAFPRTILVTLSGRELPLELTTVFGTSIVIMPGGSINLEAPAQVIEGRTVVGTGFIECNNFASSTSLMGSLSAMAGLTSALTLRPPSLAPFWRTLGILLGSVAALGLLIGLVVWLGHRSYKRHHLRQ